MATTPPSPEQRSPRLVIVVSSDAELARRVSSALRGSECAIRVSSPDAAVRLIAEHGRHIVAIDTRHVDRQSAESILALARGGFPPDVPIAMIRHDSTSNALEIIARVGRYRMAACFVNYDANLGVILRAFLNDRTGSGALGIAYDVLREVCDPAVRDILDEVLGSGLRTNTVKGCCKALGTSRSHLAHRLRLIEAETADEIIELAVASFVVAEQRITGNAIGALTRAAGYVRPQSVRDLLSRVFDITLEHIRDDEPDTSPEQFLQTVLRRHYASRTQRPDEHALL